MVLSGTGTPQTVNDCAFEGEVVVGGQRCLFLRAYVQQLDALGLNLQVLREGLVEGSLQVGVMCQARVQGLRHLDDIIFSALLLAELPHSVRDELLDGGRLLLKRSEVSAELEHLHEVVRRASFLFFDENR